MASANAGYREFLARLLRHCTSLAEGRALHAQMVAAGVDRDVLLNNMLVRMYGNCGSIGDARRVFDSIENKNRFSWNMILAAYAQHGCIDLAQAAFVEMPVRDLVAWTVLIDGLSKSSRVDEAMSAFHRSPQWDAVCWNVILAAVAQRGNCAQTKTLFDTMPEPDSVSWNTLMNAYSLQGHVSEVKDTFDQMPQRQLSSWNCLLSANAAKGHLECVEWCFDRVPCRDVITWTTLFDAYHKADELDSAKSVFHRMPERNPISWNVLVEANAAPGHFCAASEVLWRMPQQSISAWNSLLQHCTSVDSAIDTFQSMRHRDTSSWNTALGVYAPPGHHLATMRDLFDRMPARSIVSFNVVIRSHTDRDDVSSALSVLRSIPGGGGGDLISWTMVTAAMARCGGAADALGMFSSLAQRDLHCWNSLLHALVEERNDRTDRSDHLIVAKKLFDRMPAHDSCASNVMIQSLAAQNRIDAAKSVFDRIPQSFDLQLLPGTSMIANLARKASSLPKAMEIFHDLVQRDQAIWNAMLEVCARSTLACMEACLDRMPLCDEISWVVIITELSRSSPPCIDRARNLFGSIAEPTTAIWNSMIAGLCHCKLYREGIHLFREMDQCGVESDEVTFLAVLDACLEAPALAEGRIIHACLNDRFHCRHSEIITNTLVNFYGKSGCLHEAMEIFRGSKHSFGAKNNDKLDFVQGSSDVFSTSSWNVMIGAYAHNGLCDRADELLQLMSLDGCLPDLSTLTSLLTACTHAGKLQIARDYFVSLKGEFFVEPDRDHFSCIVDLLGRSGRIDEAVELTESMPFEPDAVALTSLLSSCRNSPDGQVSVAGRVLAKLADVSTKSAVFVMFSRFSIVKLTKF